MSAQGAQQGIPNLPGPMVDPKGIPTLPWYRFFISLWQRTGGNQALAPIYVPSLWFPLAPLADFELMAVCFTEPARFAVDFAGSEARCRTPATAAATIQIKHAPVGQPPNFSVVGSIVFQPASYVGTFASTNHAALNVNAGDSLLLKAQHAPDSTLGGIYASLFAVRT